MNLCRVALIVFVASTFGCASRQASRERVDLLRVARDVLDGRAPNDLEFGSPVGTSSMSEKDALKVIMVEGDYSDLARVRKFIDSGNKEVRDAAGQALSVLARSL